MYSALTICSILLAARPSTRWANSCTQVVKSCEELRCPPSPLRPKLRFRRVSGMVLGTDVFKDWGFRVSRRALMNLASGLCLSSVYEYSKEKQASMRLLHARKPEDPYHERYDGMLQNPNLWLRLKQTHTDLPS